MTICGQQRAQLQPHMVGRLSGLKNCEPGPPVQ